MRMHTLRLLIKLQEADFHVNDLKPVGISKHLYRLIVTISFYKQ